MKNYNVRICVSMTELLNIKANSQEEAKRIVREKFINNEIMEDLKYSEYYDGMYIEIEE